MDSHVIMILLAVAAAIAFLYVAVMRVFFKDSKELDKKIDYSKVKEWKDDKD